MPDITRERIDEIRRHYSIGEPGTGTWLAGTPESDIETLLSALDRRDELIRWLETMRNGQPRLDVITESAPHEWQRQNAREVLEIVGDGT